MCVFVCRIYDQLSFSLHRLNPISSQVNFHPIWWFFFLSYFLSIWLALFFLRSTVELKNAPTTIKFTSTQLNGVAYARAHTQWEQLNGQHINCLVCFVCCSIFLNKFFFLLSLLSLSIYIYFYLLLRFPFFRTIFSSNLSSCEFFHATLSTVTDLHHLGIFFFNFPRCSSVCKIILFWSKHSHIFHLTRTHTPTEIDDIKKEINK